MLRVHEIIVLITTTQIEHIFINYLYIIHVILKSHLKFILQQQYNNTTQWKMIIFYHDINNYLFMGAYFEYIQ